MGSFIVSISDGVSTGKIIDSAVFGGVKWTSDKYVVVQGFLPEVGAGAGLEPDIFFWSTL